MKYFGSYSVIISVNKKDFFVNIEEYATKFVFQVMKVGCVLPCRLDDVSKFNLKSFDGNVQRYLCKYLKEQNL